MPYYNHSTVTVVCQNNSYRQEGNALTTKKTAAGLAMLALAALLWGTALVAQSAGAGYLGPFTFNASRFLLGGTALLPIFVLERRRAAPGKRPPQQAPLVGGLCCGCVVFATASLQQLGLASTPVGKAGFLTALYIVFVPLLGIPLGRKVAPFVWLCVAAATAGLYLLCAPEGLRPATGDLLILLCALTTAVHILLIGHFSARTSAVALTCIQFYTCGVLSLAAALALEPFDPSALRAAWGPIAYTGLISCALCYTLQALGQQRVPPVWAGLVLSLESVFSALSGWLLLGESLSLRELGGCALILAAIAMAQRPGKRADSSA